jgi:hypothetical protein
MVWQVNGIRLTGGDTQLTREVAAMRYFTR